MIPRIITFCNADYIAVAQNWLLALRNIGLDKQATVISLDDKTREAFPVDRILHRPLPQKNNGLGGLWRHRISVLREFLVQGEEIIHSDADAIWLQNPMPDIKGCGTHAVFSQGTVWPPDVHRRFGFVLCCGFFYLSPQPEILDFVDEVAIRIQDEKDDQVSVNRVIAESIKSWNIELPYKILFKDTHFIASSKPIYSCSMHINAKKIKIAVLPHHAYPRLIDKIVPETIVAHPLSGKSLSEKEAILKKLGLWFL